MPTLSDIFPDAGAGMSWTTPGNITADDGSVASITLGASTTNATLTASFSAGLFAALPANAQNIVLTGTIQLRQLVDAEPTSLAQMRANLDAGYRDAVEGDVVMPTSMSDLDFTYSYTPDADDFLGGSFSFQCTFQADEDGCGIEVDYIKIKTLTYTVPDEGGLLLVGVGT